MSEALCACNRPIHDTAYRCTVCESQLRRSLQDVERIAGDITLTVAKLAKVRRRGAADIEREWYRGEGALYPMPMLVDLDKAARHDAAAGELTTWARHIAEERGRELAPRRHRLACTHTSCAAVRKHQAPGPTCALPEPAVHDLAVAARFVASNLSWLRYRPEAEEAWPALQDACLTLERVVDTAAGEVIVGRCPCEHWLYAPERAETVRCWGCGTRYDVASSRADLRENLEDRIMSGAEIAKLAGYLGIADTKKARLMIKVWAQRGKLDRRRRWHVNTAAEVVEIESVYRFGDALPLLQVAYARAA
jgi:hypothetical protein